MYKHSSREIYQSQVSHYLSKHLKVHTKVQRGSLLYCGNLRFAVYGCA
jgi:hypothetical protein